MRTRKVVYSDQAQTDLLEMELWLEARAGKHRARSYVDRLIDKCEKLELASNREPNDTTSCLVFASSGSNVA